MADQVTKPRKKTAKPRKKSARQRLLVFIVAYNAEKTITQVLTRIPAALTEQYEVEVLAIDDASPDSTFETAHSAANEQAWPFPIHVLRNPINQGYGGNQKIGFFYAQRHGFDFVALIHGDGQYAPECLPELLAPLAEGEANAVMGSRMMVSGNALKGGMPLYKYVGNKILTFFQNNVLGLTLTEFHSGYRLYSVAALNAIPFHLNTNDFHFDTEIIIQLNRAGQHIKELPIPTFYGDEICHVDGLRYAWDVVSATSRVRVQDLGLLYDPKFDCKPAAEVTPDTAKLDFQSPHTEALSRLDGRREVLELSLGEASLSDELTARGCRISVAGRRPESGMAKSVDFVRHDLNRPLPPDLLQGKQSILVLDIIEHLTSPEDFLANLREQGDLSPETELIVSTGNIAFGSLRLGLLLGAFNYSKRGILDLTHTRLFTFKTAAKLFDQAGFDVLEVKGIPAPFPLALGHGPLTDLLGALNRLAIRVWRGFFAYQIFFRARKRPTLKDLLRDAHEHSDAVLNA